MTRRRRARRRIATDPEAAFRVRARRDRKDLVRLARPLEAATGWDQAAAAVATMERITHGLAGASGVFGFADVGEHAARLERLLERWRLRPPAAISRRQLATFRRRLVPLLDGLARIEG